MFGSVRAGLNSTNVSAALATLSKNKHTGDCDNCDKSPEGRAGAAGHAVALFRSSVKDLLVTVLICASVREMVYVVTCVGGSILNYQQSDDCASDSTGNG